VIVVGSLVVRLSVTGIDLQPINTLVSLLCVVNTIAEKEQTVSSRTSNGVNDRNNGQHTLFLVNNEDLIEFAGMC